MEDQTGQSRVEFAHLLRAFAAVSVLVSHLAYGFWLKPQLVGDLIAQPDLVRLGPIAQAPIAPDFGLRDFWGFFGVGLFFLISGFVIPFSTDRLSRLGFIVARVLRIWPTYVVGLTIGVGTISFNALLLGVAFPHRLVEVLAHYLVLPRWPTLTKPIDGILWTLEVEIFFYTVCALLIVQLRRREITVLVIGILAIPAAFLISAATPRLLLLGSNAFALAHWISSMLLFTCFMLIGTTFNYHYRVRFGAWQLTLTSAGLFGIFVIAWWLGPFGQQGWSGPVSFLIALILFVGAYLVEPALTGPRGWLRRGIARLADISYPLYAVHGILGYSILAHSTRAGITPWLSLALAVAVVAAVAWLIHLAVELPSRTHGKELGIDLSQGCAPGMPPDCSRQI
jgi:peptidoglycan/LPS O-acetylase OafA/YrhL